MKKHLIVLIILAMSLPFIQGQKGCGGAIQMPGEESTTAEVDTAAAVGAGAGTESADLTGGGEGEAAESGPASIMTPEKEPEPERVSDCSRYMPDDFTLRVALDTTRLESVMEDPNIMTMLDKALDKANLNMEPKDLISSLSSVCLACQVKPAATAAEASVLASQPWRLKQCEKLLVVDVFKQDTPLQNFLPLGSVADEQGFYKFNEKFFLAQFSSNVIGFGTTDELKKATTLGATPAASQFTNQIAVFAPASISMAVAGASIESVLEHPILSIFKSAMPEAMNVFLSNTEMLGKRVFVGGLDFNLFSVGVAILEGGSTIFKSAAVASNLNDFKSMLKPAKTSAVVSTDQAAIQAEVQKLNEELITLNKQIEEISNKINVYESDVKAASEAGDTVKVQELKDVLSKLNEQKNVLINQYDAIKAKLAELEGYLKDSNSQVIQQNAPVQRANVLPNTTQ